MKRKLIIIICSVAVLITAAIAAWIWLVPHRFRLDDQYYHASDIAEINIDTLKSLIVDRKSFALLVYQPGCRTAEDFEKIVQEFSSDQQISFYKISFSTLKSSQLISDLQYYPSMVLYRDGKVKTFLHADQDADTQAFLSRSGFETWWNQYILSAQ